MSKRNEVFIFVRGGTVVEVKANDPTLQVYVVDYDEIERSDEIGHDIAEIEGLSAGLTTVY